MSAQSYEDAERTRRIQEEIRRKIAERRGGRTPPAMPSAPLQRQAAPPLLAPRPVATSVGGGLRERLQRKLMEMQQKAEAAATAHRNQERAEALRRQEVADRAAAAQRAPSQIAATAITPPKLPGEAKSVSPRSNPWRAVLQDPASLRRAIVLQEILGPPVGLR